MVNKIHDLQQPTPGNKTKIMATIHELIASTEGPEEGDAKPAQASLADRVANASGGTSEGVLRLLQDEEPFYQRITQILKQPRHLPFTLLPHSRWRRISNNALAKKSLCSSRKRKTGARCRSA